MGARQHQLRELRRVPIDGRYPWVVEDGTFTRLDESGPWRPRWTSTGRRRLSDGRSAGRRQGCQRAFDRFAVGPIGLRPCLARSSASRHWVSEAFPEAREASGWSGKAFRGPNLEGRSRGASRDEVPETCDVGVHVSRFRWQKSAVGAFRLHALEVAKLRVGPRAIVERKLASPADVEHELRDDERVHGR